MDLNQVVDELYGLAPGQFTARRDERSAEAKKAGDHDLAAAVKALRRPSAAAFAVNLMARTRGERIEALIELGGQMKAAQDALSGEGLRALGRQRSLLIHAVTLEVRGVAHEAGHPVSDAVAREIETTLEAAFADPWAGQAVRQGRLVRALERSGLGSVDLEGAVAGTLAASRPAPRSRPAPATNDQREAEQARALEAADRASAAADEAAEALAAAVAEHDAAVARRDGAESEVRRLEEALRAARTASDQAVDAEARARRARREAEEGSEEATAAAQKERAAADVIRG